ncbi:MAG: hypothetical protein IPG50_21295 [Myxococcales bacterium]|nr:hypothetical protein [Myxococcales bacterium]
MAQRLVLYDRTCTRPAGGLSAVWRGGAALYCASGAVNASVGIDDWAGAARAIEALDAPLAELQYWGHGRFGRVFVDRAPLDLRALVGAPGADAGARRVVAVLKERLVTSERSLVWLRTCEAFGGDVGQAFAEALADTLGVRVGGHTHVIGFWQSGLHSLVPGQRALWPREEGIRRGTASAPELGAGSSPGLPCTIHCLQGRVPPGW